MDAGSRYSGGVIMALDVATKTGVACGGPGETPLLETLNFARPLAEPYQPARGLDGRSDGDLLGRALVWITQRLKRDAENGKPVMLLILEGLVPQYDKTMQCGLWGIFQGVAAVRHIPVMVAPVQTWRAFVLGDGRLKRDIAKTRAVQTVTQLGWQADSHDAAEAGCIWLWAMGQVAPRHMPKIPMFMRMESAGKARGRAA